MVKSLTQINKLYADFLPNAFKNAAGASMNIKSCYGEKSKISHFNFNKIEWDCQFYQNEKGQKEFQIQADAYIGGELRYSNSEVDKSNHIANRRIEEKESKLTLKCRVKRMPKNFKKDNLLFADIFNYLVREAIRIAR